MRLTSTGLPLGGRRVLGVGTPHPKPGDTCVQIFSAGPDMMAGGGDDQLLGTGGTDASGNLVDDTGMP